MINTKYVVNLFWQNSVCFSYLASPDWAMYIAGLVKRTTSTQNLCNSMKDILNKLEMPRPLTQSTVNSCITSQGFKNVADISGTFFREYPPLVSFSFPKLLLPVFCD